jgi:hypothetical protein
VQIGDVGYRGDCWPDLLCVTPSLTQIRGISFALTTLFLSKLCKSFVTKMSPENDTQSS